MKKIELEMKIGDFRTEIIEGKKVNVVSMSGGGIAEFNYSEKDTLFLVNKDRTKAIAWKRPRIILDPKVIEGYTAGFRPKKA